MNAATGLFDAIVRPTLSSQALDQLRVRITDGRLRAGTQVTEAQLSRQLGVSRTPLHQAMVTLAREGLVEPLARKGWLIKPLSVSDARELYPILSAMECLALRTASSLAIGVAEDLRDVLEGKTDASPRTRLEREIDWHLLLLSRCGNRTLAELASSLMSRVFRYELACSEQRASKLPSELSSVLSCLEKGDVSGACRFIEIHWRDRGEYVFRLTPMAEAAKTA